MGTFQLKEGLFEYSVKRLLPEERADALRRIEKSVRLTDDSLKQFMNIGNTTVENADPPQSDQHANI
jgi:hypothetical protein